MFKNSFASGGIKHIWEIKYRREFKYCIRYWYSWVDIGDCRIVSFFHDTFPGFDARVYFYVFRLSTNYIKACIKITVFLITPPGLPYVKQIFSLTFSIIKKRISSIPLTTCRQQILSAIDRFNLRENKALFLMLVYHEVSS